MAWCWPGEGGLAVAVEPGSEDTLTTPLLPGFELNLHAFFA